MAERRMFAKSIISSGRFLRMPPSSRLLYYDLGMYADDDGVVEAFSVMRQTQATEDDLRVLVSKGFVRVLNDELVAVITDWGVNNFIRKDRYHPSIYKDLLLQLPDGHTDGIPLVNQRDTEDRIGKVSIGKDSIDAEYSHDGGKKRSRFKPPTVEEVSEYIRENGYHIDAEAFIDHYDSNGWMIGGKSKMKDWKAAVRNWERRRANNAGTQRSGNPFADMLRTGDY